MTPAVSIIIPVYNVEKYLIKTIDSCVNQTLSSVEIILVNDGSPDNCDEIIKQYAQKDSRIKVINKNNQGVTLARKDGLAIATGEYVFYLDGDDYLSNKAMGLLYNKAKQTDADWVVADFFLEFENGKIVERKFKDFGIVDNVDFLKYCFENRDFYFMGRLIRTSLIKSINLDIPSNITYGEDNLAVVQIGYQLQKAVKLNSPILYYVQRGDSVTNRVSKNDLVQRTLAIKQQLSFVKSKDVFNQIKKAVDNFVLNELYFQIVTGYIDEELAKSFLKRSFITTARRNSKMNNKQYYTLLLASYSKFFTMNVVKALKKIN